MKCELDVLCLPGLRSYHYCLVVSDDSFLVQNGPMGLNLKQAAMPPLYSLEVHPVEFAILMALLMSHLEPWDSFLCPVFLIIFYLHGSSFHSEHVKEWFRASVSLTREW